MSNVVLKVLVGSQAYGLAREDSDYDYRHVFVVPTSEILSLGTKHRSTEWVEANKNAGEKDDTTGWEIGHFLNLAIHCNPSILEVFSAPITTANIYGTQLRELFDAIWNPKGVRDAFVGYGHNQRKKLLDNRENRASKYASSCLRVLYQAWRLLSEGTLPVDMTGSPVYDTLMLWKDGMFTVGEVIDLCAKWQERVDQACSSCKHEPDLERVNKFLLFVRWRNW